LRDRTAQQDTDRSWKSDFDRNSTGTGTGSLVNLRFSLPRHVQFWLSEISEPELWIAEPRILVAEHVPLPVMNCRSTTMRVVETASEKGLKRDRLDSGCLLFRPAQSPRSDQPSNGCALQSRLGEPPGLEQQARLHFGENLAGDGSQQLRCLLEMGFLSTCGAVMRIVAEDPQNDELSG
jgi:hypothetical protein